MLSVEVVSFSPQDFVGYNVMCTMITHSEGSMVKYTIGINSLVIQFVFLVLYNCHII